MSKIKKDLQHESRKYSNAVQKIIDQAFQDEVKPYLDRTGFRLSSGMGAWCIYGKNDRMLNRNELPLKVLAILECEVYGFSQDAGSLIGDYPR